MYLFLIQSKICLKKICQHKTKNIQKLNTFKFFFENCCHSFEYCISYAANILNSQNCLTILTTWFPVAIKTVLTFKNKIKNYDETNPNQSWKDVYYHNNQSEDKTIIDLLIGQILDTFHITIQDKKGIQNLNEEKIFSNFHFKKLLDCYLNLLLEIIFKMQPNSVKIQQSHSGSSFYFTSSNSNKNGIQLFDQLFLSFSLCSPTFNDTWIKYQSLKSVNLFIDIILIKLKSNVTFCLTVKKRLKLPVVKTVPLHSVRVDESSNIPWKRPINRLLKWVNFRELK